MRKPAASTSTHSLGATTNPTTRAATARAPSPFKPTQARAPSSQPALAQVKAKVSTTARPNVTAAQSVPSVTDLRQRALTDVPSSRSRRGSISSHVSSASNATRSIYSPPRLAPTSSNEENRSGSSSVLSGGGGGPIKVRSKVTKIADHGTPSPPSVPPSPSFSSHTRPTRVPSVSSLSLSPPLGPTRSNGLSPVSTPGHGRYATTRDMSSPKMASFRSFAPFDDSTPQSRAGSPRTRSSPAAKPLRRHACRDRAGGCTREQP